MSDASSPKVCKNCGHVLELAFCPQCGQSAAVDVPTIKHFLQDAASAIFTYDSKFWRTIKPLMTQPGKLSVEYVEGRRASYVNPVPLYFWLQAICFFAFKFGLPDMAKQADDRARSLLYMVVIFSIMSAIVNFDKKRKFGEHIVFGLHLTSFLLMVLTLIYALTPLIVIIVQHLPIRLAPVEIGLLLTNMAKAIMVPYSILAIRRFYADSWIIAISKTAVMYYSYFYIYTIVLHRMNLH